MSELIGSILIGIGVAFDLLGTIGLVRLPDVYNRLQAATKCVTLGTCLILVGAGVAGGGSMAARSIICAVFILITSPVGAHALARGSHLGGVKLWEKSLVDKYEEDAQQIKRGLQQGEGNSAAARGESS